MNNYCPIYIHKSLSHITFKEINYRDEIIGYYRKNGEKYTYRANIEYYKYNQLNNGKMVMIISPHHPFEFSDLIQITI